MTQEQLELVFEMQIEKCAEILKQEKKDGDKGYIKGR